MKPLLIILLVLLDQASKFVFEDAFYDLIVFDINYVENFGITFGFFQGTSTIFGIIGLLVLGVLLYFREEFEDKPALFSLLIAGIIGNTVDRLFRGFVVDFIDFRFWPVFNFADVFLVVSVSLLIFLELREWYQNSFKSSRSSK